jgi:hypothetical protein
VRETGAGRGIPFRPGVADGVPPADRVPATASTTVIGPPGALPREEHVGLKAEPPLALEEAPDDPASKADASASMAPRPADRGLDALGF